MILNHHLQTLRESRSNQKAERERLAKRKAITDAVTALHGSRRDLEMLEMEVRWKTAEVAEKEAVLARVRVEGEW